MSLHDQWGRPFDDFDALRLRVAARAAAPDRGYSVQAEDGAPMLGFVPAELGEEPLRLVAPGWRQR